MTPDDTRAPGRPFFDPDGQRHLDAVLRAERERAPYKGNGNKMGVDSGGDPVDRASRLVDAVLESIDGVGKLYGPGAAAAILGVTAVQVDDHGWETARTTDRVSALLDIIRSLAYAVNAARDENGHESREVGRLQVELARAQDAYDKANAVVGEATLLRGTSRNLTAYVDELEEAIHRLSRRWTAGHATRTLHLARVRAEAIIAASPSDG